MSPHVLLDGVAGQGHYVGTYLAWESHQSGWWGEGEVKFYLDDDLTGAAPGQGGEGAEPPTIFPTICTTGTEDYVGGRSEEHTSELQSRGHLVCRLLLE